jgi:hypothetical protein
MARAPNHSFDIGICHGAIDADQLFQLAFEASRPRITGAVVRLNRPPCVNYRFRTIFNHEHLVSSQIARHKSYQHTLVQTQSF